MWLAEGFYCNRKYLELLVKDTKIIYPLIEKSLTGDLNNRGKIDHQLEFLPPTNCSLFIEFN